MATWGIANAKAHLSEVVYQAETRGPQKLARSGREVAVIVSLEEWKKINSVHSQASPPKQTIAEFFLNSPLRGSGLTIPRTKMRKRLPL